MPLDTGADSNLMAFLSENKIDLDKMAKSDDSNKSPEEMRALGIIKAVSSC